MHALGGASHTIASALGISRRAVRGWGEYVPDARRDRVYGLLTRLARQHDSTTLLRMAQLCTALSSSTAQHTAAQEPDLDEDLDFLLDNLDCIPIVNIAHHTTPSGAPQHCTALHSTPLHAAVPAAQHAALPGTAPQTKSAPTLCPVSTLTNSANTGRVSPVKAGLLDY